MASLMDMLSGIRPEMVARAVKDIQGNKLGPVMTGDAMGPSLGGLSKIVPTTMKNGTRVLTRVKTLDSVPRWLMEMDGGTRVSKAMSVNPATVSDMAQKVTKAPSAKSVWETVDNLAAKGKGRKILYHVNKNREPL